jgi:hypothetical protein
MIDLEKKYTNKHNDEIKLSHIDRGIVYGWLKLGIDWYSHQWDKKTGKVLLNAPDVNNLIELKPRIKKTVWLNIYEYCFLCCSSKEEADHYDGDDRLACIRVEIDCEEGEGL